MKVKKVPMRTCVITHEKLEKRDLLRVVRDNEGNVFVDETGKANGRGAYVKKDKEIIEEARKKKVLNHIFNMDVSDDVYENLKELV